MSTLDFLKKVRFDIVTLYPYYDGYDTPASKLESKISPQTIQERLKTAEKILRKEKIIPIVWS